MQAINDYCSLRRTATGIAQLTITNAGSLNIMNSAVMNGVREGLELLAKDRDVRALVVTGSPTRPTGVFQAHSGELVVTAVSDSTIRGFFRLEATGFLATEPDREDRTVSAAGTFAATGR